METSAVKSEKRSKSRGSKKAAKRGKSSKSAKTSKSLKSSKSQKSSKVKKECPPDSIRFIHGNGDLFVKEADLVAVSALMKVRQSENRFARAIDLKEFSWNCLKLLEEYIISRKIKANVSFYVVAELLKLTKIFAIEELHKKMEEILVEAAMQNGANLTQALLVNNVAPVSREIEIQLHYLGAWRFLDLVRQPDFHQLPPHQFLQIFGSCELNVSHELVAVDAALYYLAGQPNLEFLAPAVFAMVRSTYLGKLERQMIVERMQVLNFPESVIRISKAILDSRHNNRICLNPEHIKKHVVRCGIYDPSLHPHEMTLPLSRPRDGLTRPPKTDNRSKKSRKSERSGKSHKVRISKKGGKSQKSKKMPVSV